MTYEEMLKHHCTNHTAWAVAACGTKTADEKIDACSTEQEEDLYAALRAARLREKDCLRRMKKSSAALSAALADEVKRAAL